MSGYTVNYDDWRLEPTLKLYELASILNGIDPRALSDEVDQYGDPMDMSSDIAALKARVDLGELTCFKANTLPSLVEVTMASAIECLRTMGKWGTAKKLSLHVHPEDGPITKKSDIVRAHKSTWPKIEEDIKRSAENGLAEEAASDTSGYWLAGAALRWARRNGKLKSHTTTNHQIGAALTSKPTK